MAIKNIPIDQLTINMYVIDIDISWMKTPFLTHKKLIKTKSDWLALWHSKNVVQKL